MSTPVPGEPSEQGVMPYPPVFHDWRDHRKGRRVSTGLAPGGVIVEMFQPEAGSWRQVELTEVDACLLAASLLQRAGRDEKSMLCVMLTPRRRSHDLAHHHRPNSR